MYEFDLWIAMFVIILLTLYFFIYFFSECLNDHKKYTWNLIEMYPLHQVSTDCLMGKRDIQSAFT